MENLHRDYHTNTAEDRGGAARSRGLDARDLEARAPQLDLATEGIVERIQKIAWRINKAMDETLAAHDLNKGEWRLLGALRRHGPPYRRSPGQLAEEMGLSSGAMTNRLDRLETAGLIRRQRDLNDRRAIEVELTDAGWQAWQTTVGTQAIKEAADRLRARRE